MWLLARSMRCYSRCFSWYVCLFYRLKNSNRECIEEIAGKVPQLMVISCFPSQCSLLHGHCEKERRNTQRGAWSYAHTRRLRWGLLLPHSVAWPSVTPSQWGVESPPPEQVMLPLGSPAQRPTQQGPTESWIFPAGILGHCETQLRCLRSGQWFPSGWSYRGHELDSEAASCVSLSKPLELSGTWFLRWVLGWVNAFGETQWHLCFLSSKGGNVARVT